MSNTIARGPNSGGGGGNAADSTRRNATTKANMKLKVEMGHKSNEKSSKNCSAKWNLMFQVTVNSDRNSIFYLELYIVIAPLKYWSLDTSF